MYVHVCACKCVGKRERDPSHGHAQSVEEKIPEGSQLETAFSLGVLESWKIGKGELEEKWCIGDGSGSGVRSSEI